MLREFGAHDAALALADNQAAAITHWFAGGTDFHGRENGNQRIGDGAGAGVEGKRYTILPLSRSYGVISTFTLSPGRMRTR